MSFLIEKRRNELVAQSKQSVKGLERFREAKCEVLGVVLNRVEV